MTSAGAIRSDGASMQDMQTTTMALAALGPTLTLGAAVTLLRRRARFSTWTRGVGTVVGFRVRRARRDGRTRTFYHAQVRYLAGGREWVYESPVSTTAPSREVGDEVAMIHEMDAEGQGTVCLHARFLRRRLGLATVDAAAGSCLRGLELRGKGETHAGRGCTDLRSSRGASANDPARSLRPDGPPSSACTASPRPFAEGESHEWGMRWACAGGAFGRSCARSDFVSVSTNREASS